MFRRLWQEEEGIVVLEYLLVATLVSFFTIGALSVVGNVVSSELLDLAQVIRSLDHTITWTVPADVSCGATQLVNYGQGTLATDATTPLVYTANTTLPVDLATTCP